MFNYWTPTVSNQSRLDSYCVPSLNSLNLSLSFNLLLSLPACCYFCCCFADRSTKTVSKDTSLLGSQIYWKQLHKPHDQYTDACICVCVHAHFLFVCVFSFLLAGTEINLSSTKENNYHSCKRKEGGGLSWARDREIERQRERLMGPWLPFP